MKQLFVLTTLLAVLAAFPACGGSDTEPSTTSSTSSTGDGMSSITTLQVTDVKVGTGADATNGKNVTVHYTGWLYRESAPDKKGTKFDSSVDRNQPFSFVLGAGQVIRGWDQGVAGMKVGGQRTLVIPPSLGYGSTGAGGVIPPNATLVFDVELIGTR